MLGQIIKGFGSPLTEVHRLLLANVLLPLHKNNEMYEWRDQIPLLQLYHEPLVFCLVQYLERDRSLAVPVVEAVLRAWPEGYQSNTPKVRVTTSHQECSATQLQRSLGTQSICTQRTSLKLV